MSRIIEVLKKASVRNWVIWWVTGGGHWEFPKKIGAAPMGPPLTLRNYMFQRARQHTVIYVIGWLWEYFSKKTA